MAFSGIPLPKVVADVGPGGGIITGMQGANALTKSNLENKYYGPNIQSEIDKRIAETKGLNITNQYLPEKLKQANIFSQLQNQYYAPNIQSEIASRNALASKYNTMTPLEAEELKLKNQFYPDLIRAQIQNYQIGGRGGLGVGAKDDLIFQKSIATDNPTFNDNDARIAANLVSQGQNTMPDGRPINFSPTSQRAYDRALKSTTTSPVITQGIRSNQAEAELKVLNDYAQKGLEPYGNTYLNKSPQQIVDSFKSDEKSQLRLGKLIAAQALGYEAAQNRIRLANGQPGVSSTEELMRLSGQQISTHFPMLSYTARKEAARYMDEALKKGLEARRSVGIGASSVVGKKQSSNKNEKESGSNWIYNQQTGKLERK